MSKTRFRSLGTESFDFSTDSCTFLIFATKEA